MQIWHFTSPYSGYSWTEAYKEAVAFLQFRQAFGLGSLRTDAINGPLASVIYWTEAIRAVKILNSRALATIHRLPQLSSLCANFSTLPPPPRSASVGNQHPLSIVMRRRLRRAVQVHRLQITSRRGWVRNCFVHLIISSLWCSIYIGITFLLSFRWRNTWWIQNRVLSFQNFRLFWIQYLILQRRVFWLNLSLLDFVLCFSWSHG